MTKNVKKKEKEDGITSEQVRQLGNLAKITMTAAEEQKIQKELSAILDYFDIVDGVEQDVAIDQASEDAENLRADDVRPSDPEGVLKGVPQRKGRFVKAPRVF